MPILIRERLANGDSRPTMVRKFDATANSPEETDSANNKSKYSGNGRQSLDFSLRRFTESKCLGYGSQLLVFLKWFHAAVPAPSLRSCASQPLA